MIKLLVLIVMLGVGLWGQKITPYSILPLRTTQNAVTSYSIVFQTDTNVPSNAQVAVTFPFEFSPSALTQATRVRYALGDGALTTASWTLNLYTFTVPISSIQAGNVTIVIDGVLNPTDYTTSSYFTVQTLFKNVVVTSNNEFGRTPFTKTPIATAGGVFENYLNTYIEQGASWTFKFTPSTNYPSNTSLRFVFPEGFTSNGVQCNVSGVVDPRMITRLFPSKNVYDCLNLYMPLTGAITVILSGLVNPNYQTSVTGVEVHILEANNLIVQQVISSASSVLIKNKTLNATVTILNQYRNSSATYVFQINTDTNLGPGDYLTFTFTGTWNLLTNITHVIDGLFSSPTLTPRWTVTSNSSVPSTTLSLTNFSSILKSTQFTFYQPLVTPLNPSTYSLRIDAFRANGKLAQTYTRSIVINQTTGYIRQMKLHPMQSPIKLPVSKTGPIQIVLFLRNDLPKTNVLTYGKIIMNIRPNIPAPIVSLNGVPKCYFYYDVPAANCSFDSTTDPTKTIVTIFTPVDFNFQQSEIPLTITTEGFQTPTDQGITLDTLVKRYFFQIQFYSHLRPEPVPLEVIFDEWIPDSIPITSMSCITMSRQYNLNDHLLCTFVTPDQVLNDGGHIHFFRFEFVNYGIPVNNVITPDYPCLMYGVNVTANPYVRCDFVTWTSGPYQSSQLSTDYVYMTFYGMETIPGGSTITFQMPKIQRSTSSTSLKFSILEDTPGYSSPIVYIYTQTIGTSSYTNNIYSPSWETPSITLSNGIINKVTDITLNSYSLAFPNPAYVIFQIDQSAFPNIGRGQGIACGSHTCSKFDIPAQYFVLTPTTPLGSTATLTFPSIKTPAYSGSFTFQTRVLYGDALRKYGQFSVTIQPDTITTRSYAFHSNETITSLYPNSDHFYTVGWTTVNPLLTQGGNAYITVTLDNVFTFSSTYCQLTTSASAYPDTRGIICQLTKGGTVVTIKNLNDVPTGSTFSLNIQLRSTSTTSTVSPTVSIRTYYGNGALVDQALNVAFAITPLPNANLTIFNAFSLPSSSVSTRAITAGYFGHLLVSFQPESSGTVVNGSKIVLTMPSGFSPATNSLGLPLSCKLNGVRFACTYTVSPFVVTLTSTNNSFTTSSNVINITTEYQNSNGVYFPATQGRYQLQLEILNKTTGESLQKVQQTVDILPPDLGYFNASWAVRDIGVINILTLQLKNGPTSIPSYADGANQGRIYLGFPTLNALGQTVFAADLGFSGAVEGTLLPCYFQTGSGFATPISGTSLTCKLRKSLTNSYNAWVEITNFDVIPAGGKLRVIIGKIVNPGVKQIDINFQVKINTLAVATNIESTLYESSYNMFIDMVTSATVARNEVNSNSIFFQAGAKVGSANQYFGITPYSQGTFAPNDWWIVDLDPQFPLSGTVINCQQPFYQYCIVFPTINWLAVKIGNGSLISLQPFISQLPLSISRTDTIFSGYTFMAGRYSEIITYTLTASARWLELRGVISNFNYQVVGSQNKLNVGQKDVEVLVSFRVEHKVPKGGSIEVQFPNNATTVPAIKQHCRSSVTMGSQLYGYDTGKPALNVQGEVGCTVQNSYSWIITGFAELPANSQVIIYGKVDFPTTAVSSLGMGFVCTYSNQDATNTFANSRTIDYLTTSFPLQVQNLTWSVDPGMAMLKTEPLRTGYVGELKFFVNFDSTFQCSSFGTGSSGQIYINLFRNSITGTSGGFGAPPGVIVCSIVNPATKYKYGCYVNYYSGTSDYYGYQILSYQNLPSNTLLEVTVTSLQGSGVEGITFPTSVGSYKTEIEINYCDGCSNNKAQAQYVEVYGPDWNFLQFNSTVTIPGENNFVIVVLTPSSSITTTQQIVIEIPTVALDGTALYPADLGMGYKPYDSLVFDLFESSISSMDCRVYPGEQNYQQPTKIVCSSFSGTLTTSSTVKFGFWMINPSTTVGLAIPVQVYAYDQTYARKFVWSIMEAGIRVLPVTVTPISDLGNFVTSKVYREGSGANFDFTTRNTKAMVRYDWYILKFNFPLRQSANSNGNFKYRTDFALSGDVIFMQRCRTVLLRMGTSDLAIMAPGSTSPNGRINSLFYTPPTQLTTAQASIKAYAIYNSRDLCERIYYSDAFPALPPYEPAGPTFTITPIFATNQMAMNDDWTINFVMSSTAGNSTSLLKLISIEFPSLSTSDMVIQSKQCMEYLTSTIEVAKCVIDPDARVIWVTPVQKSTYTDSSSLTIQTAGLAIKTAVSLATNHNQFTIRYFTWEGDNNPGVTAGSDNWCFMKQDSTRIGSSALPLQDYTSTYYSPHSRISVPESVYVNEWEPADYFINNGSVTASLSKSPFEFKLIVTSTFNSLEGTANYHSLKVDFGSYYTYPTINQNSLDLYFYTPVCLLNGFSILDCSISGTTITMRFQQPIANGATIGATFNILNPKDEADQGFTLANTNNPTITLPVYLYNYNSGVTYQIEQEPFHTYYKSTSAGATYPSYGIQDVSVVYGTQVQGQLNYLEFTVTLTRTDINGFVIEIPVVSPDGNKIYNSPILMGLDSGSEYPCSLGPYVPVYCYYTQGSANGFGSPTRIYVTGFTLPISTTFNLQMLFTNPDNPNVFPSFTWKAFGGSYSLPDLMGKQMMGVHMLRDPYMVYPTTNYYSTGTLNCYPDKGLWQTGTTYACYTSQESMGSNTYAILKWPLVDPTYGTIGDYSYYSTDIYDHFFMNQGVNQQYVYLVKKLTSGFTAANGGSAAYDYISSYYRFGYLRMKHHIVNNYQMVLLMKPSTKVYTVSVVASWMNSYRVSNTYGTWSIRNIDTQVKISGYNGWQFASVNAGNTMSGYASNIYDPSEKVVEVQFFTNKPYSSLSSTPTDCSLESGLIGNDPLNPITCYLDQASNRILFYNVFWFTDTFLNFYYYATTNSDQTNFDVRVYVWANPQAYAERSWIMYTSTTATDWTYDSIGYASDTGFSQMSGSEKPFGNSVMDLTSGANGVGYTRIFNGHNTRTEGYSDIYYVSSNQIKVRLYASVSRSFAQVWRMGFRFYTPRLTVDSCSSISVYTSRWGTLPFSSAASPGSINSYCGTGGTGSRRFYAIFDMYYTTSSSRNSDQWPSFANGDTYEFTFTFSSVGGDRGNYPNYLWVSASMLFENHYYYYQHSICGCCSRPCCTYCCCSGSCCSYCCDPCCTYCTCRDMRWWDYYTFTGTQGVGYEQPANLIASGASIDLLSTQYGVETEFSFYLQSLNAGIDSTMTSFTDGAHAELLVELTGNTYYPGYPSSSNPFPYTDSAQSSAYIDCLCASSGSAFSITYSTVYAQANCTRHILTGFNPLITVRYAANTGTYLRCYFPGFKTPGSSAYGASITANFYWNSMHFFKRQGLPYQLYSPYQTKGASISLTTQGTVNQMQSVNEASLFWTTQGAVNEAKRYYLYADEYSAHTNPSVYYSHYYPKPSQSACANSNFIACRTYSSFINRRYFMIATRNGYTDKATFDYTANFPDSKDYASSFYNNYYLGWTSNDNDANRYYYSIYTTTSNPGYLSSAAPTYGVTVPIFGNTLISTSTAFVVTVDLNGNTLYSNRRTSGSFRGSFIQLTASNFATLYGCGATLHYQNNRAFYNNALYCSVMTSTQIKIWSNSDLTFTGKLLITLATSSVPASTTFTFELYDKYISSTDYGRSVQVQQTITDNPSSVTVLPSTNILWRRMTYKQLRTDAGPLRVTINNNYQYVSVYNMASNSQNTATSNGIVILLPVTLSTSTQYKCLAREYPLTQYHLYTEYPIDCSAYSATQVVIQSMASHILNPSYYYEFIVYTNAGSGSPFITTNSSNNYQLRVWSGYGYTSFTTKYFDTVPVKKYMSVIPVTLNSIYILTREAAVLNSLYISLAVGVATTSAYYLELVLDPLDLSYFGIQNGDEIPCFLSGISAYAGKTKGPICFGYAPGTTGASPLLVRVLNFGSFSAGQTVIIALDNFNNPPTQNLFRVPINLRVRFVDANNEKYYSSYFPMIYFSDSLNVKNASTSTGSLSANNGYLGASTYLTWTLGWPYSSGSNVWDKMVLRLNGGVTCCRTFSSLTLSDNITGYTNLWINTRANVSVYIMPSRSSSTSTRFYINNVINPNPVSYATYQVGLTADIAWYSVYQLYNVYRLAQPDYSAYTKNTDFSVSNGAYVSASAPVHNPSHQYYPITYEINWNLASSTYPSRNISYIMLIFTGGVRWIDTAWFRYGPGVINPSGSPKVGYSTTSSQWYINITGVQDSSLSSSYNWYLRVRLFANNNNYVSYSSYVYNYNGQQEFTATSGGFTPSSAASFSTSSLYGTPNQWTFQHLRYTYGYYQLQRTQLTAQAARTTNKLFFKFTAPYDISSVESFTFSSSSNSYPSPVTPNNGLHCIIQPAFSAYVSYGVGLYSPCSYSTPYFTVNAPAGGLAKNKQYLLTVIDRQQLSSSFSMPTSPQRVEISLIYNNMLSLAYGDVYTLDFPGKMTSYSTDHSHLMSGYYDMLGFTFRPSFALPAASTSAPVTESVLSFQVESRYYDECLSLAAVYSSDGMPFYNGVYFSHYAGTAVPNANTRIFCGKDVQAQNWAPAILSITDYGALSTSSSYYFRFPLITLPSGTNVPLVYGVRLLSYANGAAYPTIISQFVDEAKYRSTGATSDSNQWAELQLGSNVVQNTMSMTFRYIYSNFGNGAETIVKFKNNMIPALTSLSTLTSISQTYYTYQYYPNINVCSYQFTSSSGDSFTLGTYSTSIDQQDFSLSFVQTFSGTTRWQGWFNSGTNTATYTVSSATSWTSSSFTKGSNLLGTNSIDKYTLSWSADYLSFPQGSYMLVTFSSNLIILDEHCFSYSGFLKGTAPNSNLVCKRYSSNQILVAGYATLAPSAALSITLYMKISNTASINTTSGANNDITATASITVTSSLGSNIISAATNSLLLALVNRRGSNQVALSGTMEKPYSAGNSFPLFITFQLNTHGLVSGDYLQINFGDWVLDTAVAGKQVFKYQLSGSTYWVPSAATLVSGNTYKVPVYLNYSMTAGTVIKIWVDTFAPDSYYGAKDPTQNWNTIGIQAYQSSTLVEQEVLKVWTEPYAHASLSVTSALNYVGATTLYEFTVTPNISAAIGDTILLEFTTADGFKTSLFPTTLGASIPAPSPGFLDCNEMYNTHVISDSVIQCRVYQGDSAASPSVPAVVAIPITKAIAANTQIKFNILNMVNPSQIGYPIGVVFKLSSTCNSFDSNNLCAYYKSVTYMTFNTAPSYFGPSTTGSLAFSPTLVSATNAVHTLSAGYSLNAGDWVKVIYYSQVPIPTVCNLVSANGECYSYSSTNSILIKAGSSQSGSYSFQLGGMTNPYQNTYGGNTFYTQVWQGGVITRKFYTNYGAATITTDPASGEQLLISFTPTKTPNYQLKYGFENIARVEITHMLQNANVKQIYIYTSGGITINYNYCNATMLTYAWEALPYPYRLVCQGMGTTWVRLNLQSDFPAWNSSFTGRSIFVYLSYVISDNVTPYCSNWTANAYSDPSSTSSNYLISQATGRFPIVEYLLPNLYVISLWTKSFQQRTCRVGQQCMFYGFLLPTTPSSTLAINYFTFILPKQFKYSTAQTLDRCTVQPTTTQLYPVTCAVSRDSVALTIKFSPSSYTQSLYNLISIDHSSTSLLFTAPPYPGDHYQMQTNLWTSAGALVESQKINITTVYGYYLSVPDIVFSIPKDGGAKGLFDLTFLVGTVDILPGYDNSASNSVTSSIEISFANTFAADLGTGKKAGEEIACLNISGLTFNTMGRITCKIYPSVSTITYPTILVTGYDRIYANTQVRIQFGDLQTLPTSVTDYCKLGVRLSYFNYGGAAGYIYEPVSVVVGPPSAPASPKTITFTVSELGSNRVGELTNYSFSGSLGTGFAPVTTSDYVLIQFPPYTFQGRFNLNSQALCSLATSSKCSVFGLAGQVYLQPSSTISTAAFSFTLKNILNAAYSIIYVNKTISLITVVGGKVDAKGEATLLKFTQPTTNVSAIITSIGSIYGGDSGISYSISFQLNSYLPENGKIAIFFPNIYTSLFTTKSSCALRSDSQLRAGLQAYCSVINSLQLVIVPNGVLLSRTMPYYLTVFNITNPNVDLTTYTFTIETYYFSSVYGPAVIGRSTFSSPTISTITVKECQLQVSISISNPQLPSQYQFSLICPSSIREASELRIYLSWAPTAMNGTCSSDSTTLYSRQCNIVEEYSGTSKLTYLQVYLRTITAQKLVSITGTITNGIQGTYTIGSTISYNGFVYMKAASNAFYISSASSSALATSVTSSASSTIITSGGQAISVKSNNYPRNRLYSSIYTFAFTRPTFVVSTLQIDLPDLLTASADGVTCGYQSYIQPDNYFNIMKQYGLNQLTCELSGQKLLLKGLTSVLSAVATGSLVYLRVEGLLNPQTSVNGANFTFTFINTTSSYTQAVLLFSLPLSFPVSNPPYDMQISGVELSNSKFFATSIYTFRLSTTAAQLTIPQEAQLGVIVRFPQEYQEVWSQIVTPTVVNLTIGTTVYQATNVSIGKRRLFGVFSQSVFPTQLDFSIFNVSFEFRNPNKSVDCSVDPIFTVSLFNFKTNSIYSQTLSNREACPTFTTHLYSINVTGNTKIPAGSSVPFRVTLEKAASNLTIIPTCASSAISFSPTQIYFTNYASNYQEFNISAANGLNGSFNVTFIKTEGGAYVFYSDIQYITLNVYVPTTKYFIRITPFVSKSVGNPIPVILQLQVPSPTAFALLITHNCSSGYAFEPSSRITVPAQKTNVTFTVAYTGSQVPPACTQNFTISSLTTNNYYLESPSVYYSSSLSIDKTQVLSPLVLELSTSPKSSGDVGHAIYSGGSTSSSKYAPSVYNVTSTAIGSNSATFKATTSYIGTVYFAVVISGTPTTRITAPLIYNQSTPSGVAYGNSPASLESSGVNTVSILVASGLQAQKSYLLAVYLNSTVGISALYFLNFSTAKVSNAAAIKLALNDTVDNIHLIESISQVLRINSSRVYILTNRQVLTDQKDSYQVSVMNKRLYMYDVLVAPNPQDDSTRPIALLKAFSSDSNAKSMLTQFVPQFLKTQATPVREVFNTVPKIRKPITIKSKTYESVTFTMAFWAPAFVYSVIRESPTVGLLSAQVINGLDENNTAVVTQHYANVTTDDSGLAEITFKLLNDNSTYQISVSAECPLPYSPRLALSNAQVMKISLTTPLNPNLIRNKNEAIQTIANQNPALAQQAQKLIKYVQAQKKIQGVDKTKKDRG